MNRLDLNLTGKRPFPAPPDPSPSPSNLTNAAKRSCPNPSPKQRFPRFRARQKLFIAEKKFWDTIVTLEDFHLLTDLNNQCLEHNVSYSFCSTSLPPPSTRWFDQRIQAFHTLKKCRWFISATSINISSEKFLGTPRIEPGNFVLVPKVSGGGGTAGRAISFHTRGHQFEFRQQSWTFSTYCFWKKTRVKEKRFNVQTRRLLWKKDLIFGALTVNRAEISVVSKLELIILVLVVQAHFIFFFDLHWLMLAVHL